MSFDEFLSLLVIALFKFKRSFDRFDLFVDDGQTVVLLSECLILRFDLILELSDLMRGDLEFALEFSHFILRLNEVLGVEVSVGAHGLVETLLLFELAFELDVLLLEFGYKVLLEFDLFDHLHEISVGLGSLVGELVPLLLEFGHVLEYPLERGLGSFHVDHEIIVYGLLLLDQILGLDVLGLGPLDAHTHLVSVVLETDDVLLLLVDLSAEVLDLAGQRRHARLRQVLLLYRLHLLAR